jgi:twinkle protein
MKAYSDYGIDIPNNKYKGEVVAICPECSHTRKKKKEKCLGVNLDKKIWHCNHCGWKGGLPNEFKIETKTYIKPIASNKTGASENLIKWFESRGINQETLNHFKIVDKKEWMPQTQKEENVCMFQYFRNDELINIKYRDGAKNFKLHKDAELIFYNLDSVKNFEDCYIVEGEIDCLSLYQCGIFNVLSVPNGANLNSNNLTYIENSYDEISHLKRFHIATDNDVAGRMLRDAIATRFGKENCDFITFNDCKDANDCLQKYGTEEVMDCISKKYQFPIEGAFTIEDFNDDIDDFYYNGLPVGAKIGVEEIDKLVSFHKGYISVITGIPSHGKTAALDYIITRLNLTEKWTGAFYSPENKPTKLHFSKLARLYIGKSWDGYNKMTYDEMSDVKEYLNDKFWFIKPEKDFTLDTILSSVKRLILLKGIDFFVIDAWNKLEHKDDSTSYVGKELDKLADFCELNNVHCFLVAHPTKMKKDKDGIRFEVPSLYDISGSANFYNKADLGICIYRNFDTNVTTMIIQKIKFNHWGETGAIDLKYQLQNGRYYLETKGSDNSSWLKRTQNLGVLSTVTKPIVEQSNLKDTEKFSNKTIKPSLKLESFNVEEEYDDDVAPF